MLDGAKALALPTKYGQFLTVKPINEHKLLWKSLDNDNNVWFEDEFLLINDEISHVVRNDNSISKRLINILNEAKKLNPDFLTYEKGYAITSTLEFPKNWGLGSSSTLLNNIAQWAKVDAFKLSDATFGGSGYDIACAQNSTPIFYNKAKTLQINPVEFNPKFKDQLFFVYLNEKKNSRDAIKTYEENKSNLEDTIQKVNTISEALPTVNNLTDFEDYLNTHEILIASITNQTPVKQRLFKDFKGAIKSLGGWGGDFVLATGNSNYVINYFKSKGYTTIVSYNNMILK